MSVPNNKSDEGTKWLVTEVRSSNPDFNTNIIADNSTDAFTLLQVMASYSRNNLRDLVIDAVDGLLMEKPITQQSMLKREIFN